jgi:SAM-dependent methyltransferase
MLFPHDHFYPGFVELLAEVARAPLVLDLGTYSGFRKELSLHRSSFQNRYYSMDLTHQSGNEGPDVVGDILRLPFADASADAVLCKEVLEHVRDPAAAVDEIHRVLKRGGAVLCTIPFLHPYHGTRGKLPDFWRFTEEGAAELFSGFTSVEVRRAGGAVFVLRVFSPLPLRKALSSRLLAPFVNAVDRMTLRFGATHLFMVLARK